MMKDSRVVTFSSPFNRSSNKTSMVLLSSGDASDEERSFTSGTPGDVELSHSDCTSVYKPCADWDAEWWSAKPFRSAEFPNSFCSSLDAEEQDSDV
jgi:hypothetical protein